jgi:hypothetical protein
VLSLFTAAKMCFCCDGFVTCSMSPQMKTYAITMKFLKINPFSLIHSGKKDKEEMRLNRGSIFVLTLVLLMLINDVYSRRGRSRGRSKSRVSELRWK